MHTRNSVATPHGCNVKRLRGRVSFGGHRTAQSHLFPLRLQGSHMDDIALTLLLRAVAKQPFFDTLMRCACDHSANDRFSHDRFFGSARSAASLHAATNVRCIQGGHITWRRTFSVKRTMAWPWLLQISSTRSRTDAHSPHVSAAEHGCEQHSLGPALGGPCGHHPVLPMIAVAHCCTDAPHRSCVAVRYGWCFA